VKLQCIVKLHGIVTFQTEQWNFTILWYFKSRSNRSN